METININGKELELKTTLKDLLKIERELKYPVLDFFTKTNDSNTPSFSTQDLIVVLRNSLKPLHSIQEAEDILQEIIDNEGLQGIYQLFVKLGNACNFFQQPKNQAT